MLWETSYLRQKISLWTDVSDDAFKRSLEKLEAELWLYAEQIYFSNHPLGHEFHGPYETEEGVLLVKEFYDLRPEIWGFTSKLSFKSAKFFEVYKKGTVMSIDFFGRGVDAVKGYRENLLKVYMQVDDAVVTSAAQLKKYVDDLEKVMENGAKEIESLDQKTMLQKYMEIWYWALKPLKEKLNEDWRPPARQYEKFKQEIDPTSLFEGFNKTAKLPVEQQKIEMSKRFDPRV